MYEVLQKTEKKTLKKWIIKPWSDQMFKSRFSKSRAEPNSKQISYLFSKNRNKVASKQPHGETLSDPFFN